MGSLGWEPEDSLQLFGNISLPAKCHVTLCLGCRILPSFLFRKALRYNPGLTEVNRFFFIDLIDLGSDVHSHYLLVYILQFCTSWDQQKSKAWKQCDFQRSVTGTFCKAACGNQSD